MANIISLGRSLKVLNAPSLTTVQYLISTFYLFGVMILNLRCTFCTSPLFLSNGESISIN